MNALKKCKQISQNTSIKCLAILHCQHHLLTTQPLAMLSQYIQVIVQQLWAFRFTRSRRGYVHLVVLVVMLLPRTLLVNVLEQSLQVWGISGLHRDEDMPISGADRLVEQFEESIVRDGSSTGRDQRSGQFVWPRILVAGVYETEDIGQGSRVCLAYDILITMSVGHENVLTLSRTCICCSCRRQSVAYASFRSLSDASRPSSDTRRFLAGGSPRLLNT